MAGSGLARPHTARPGMASPGTREIGTAAQSSWPVWGMEAAVTVTDAGVLAGAEGIVRSVVAGVDLACSRFRPDSELMALQPGMAGGARISPMFRLLLERALDVARMTDGDVDPTLGADLDRLGSGPASGMPATGSAGIRSVAVQDPPAPMAPVAPRVPGWSRVRLDSATVTVPPDLRLDLGATAKAVAADLAAAEAYHRLGCGVLVSLGGDLASAGPGPLVDRTGAWQIMVQDLPSDPYQQVALAPGFAMATSSTQKRRWQHRGAEVHHILDPRFGLPAEAVWRSVTVAARTCQEANAYSTAAVVRGFAALEWFRSRGIAARLVDSRGRIAVTGGWPPAEDQGGGGGIHG